MTFAERVVPPWVTSTTPRRLRRRAPGSCGRTSTGAVVRASTTHACVAALPTDPEALLRLVREQTRSSGGPGSDADQWAFNAIGTLPAETWAPPEVTAALSRAAALVPGVTVLPSATHAAGREGVAVARTAHGEQTQWIFDRTTSVFLAGSTPGGRRPRGVGDAREGGRLRAG
ncbi:CU044_5270 family protein [Streptomyces sp. NPDC088757]|uniref:CU044_5270 family protein n=1 Tax=Streptomyces sp. NPDC088757 TaxID=3365889 RepID=UPI0037FBF930